MSRTKYHILYFTPIPVEPKQLPDRFALDRPRSRAKLGFAPNLVPPLGPIQRPFPVQQSGFMWIMRKRQPKPLLAPGQPKTAHLLVARRNPFPAGHLVTMEEAVHCATAIQSVPLAS